MAISQFTTTLKEKKYLTEDVMLLSFTAPADFSFQAGQYVMIDLIEKGMRRIKPYSILNPPAEKGKIDLCAKIIEGGFASEVFKQMKLNGTFTFRGPIGHFTFDELAEEHWFICNGTGLTPLYSMLMENINKYPQKRFVLLFGAPSKGKVLFYDELKQLQKKHKNFTYTPTLSQDSWEGARGRVQQHLPADLQGKIFYVCGLREMVLETKELLLSKGALSEKIRVERYT